MHTSLRHRNSKQHSGRQIATTPQCFLLLAVCILGTIPGHHALAQSKPAGAEKSPLCTRDNALDMIKQQIDAAKTLNNSARRITVLIRAAHLLWPYQQEKARAVFTDAFELALQNEKEIDQSSPRYLLTRMKVPDQRHVVIRAVAKRDPALAKELTRQMLKLDTQDRESSATRDSFKDVLTASRLLDSAIKLIDTDINAAFDLARASLNYPASSWLTRFLYRLAEVNQQAAADQFYAQALAVYGDRPMREFLYLQGFPFAWRETLNTPIFSFYQVPPSFVTNQSLQRRFVQVLLRRAHQVLEAPLDETDTYQNQSATWTPGIVHLLQGLILIEPQVKASLPDLLGPLTQAREKILVSLSVERQRQFLQPGREVSTSEATEASFKEEIEAAEKIPNVNERDDRIAQAVLNNTSDRESLAAVVEALEKITESGIREGLLELIYFRRATAALDAKQFDEAERLAARVKGNEQRAYLHNEIAKALLNRSETQTHARELLDEAITDAKRAGATIFAVRALLTASHLYTKIELSRSISVLADAVSCINQIEDPDFYSDGQSLEKNPRRRSNPGNFLFWFYMPGHDPESAFLEMAKIDFDNSLYQASALTDKFQRAMATLSLADVCLQQQQQPKEKPKKRSKS